MTAYGPMREDVTLPPVSGKALPVYRGEVLRIVQVEGGQCVDFNAFNLHDYKEYLGVSNTRSYYGFRPEQGDLVWSVHSRNRPIYAILEMPETCASDLLGGRCKASLNYQDGFSPDAFGIHTNCQDTLAAAIGEYGLTADDVHDSFNLWMNSEWDTAGRYWTERNTGLPGDRVDLLAMFDTLAVAAICGSGDLGPTSNFCFGSIQLQVFERSAETERLVASYEDRYARTARTLADFQVKEIKADRELRRNPDYKPQFVNFPITTRRFPVELDAEQYPALQALKRAGIGKTDGEALRTAFFMWYSRNRRRVSVRARVRWP